MGITVNIQPVNIQLENIIFNKFFLIEQKVNDLLKKDKLVLTEKELKQKEFLIYLIKTNLMYVLNILIQNEKLFAQTVDNKLFLGRVIGIQKKANSIDYISVLDFLQEFRRGISKGKIIVGLNINYSVLSISLPKNFIDYMKVIEYDNIQEFKITKENGEELNQLYFTKGNYIIKQIIDAVNVRLKKKIWVKK